MYNNEFLYINKFEFKRTLNMFRMKIWKTISDTMIYKFREINKITTTNINNNMYSYFTVFLFKLIYHLQF